MAVYDIDLLRAVFVDKLNDSSIFLASFYEQIQEPEQIERYVENIKELLALQNREQEKSNYKAMGIIAQSGNAEIINIKQNYISPLEYQARFEIELNDRDYVLGKLKTLINDLRGRKFDVVQLTNGSIVVLKEPSEQLMSKQSYLLYGPNQLPPLSNEMIIETGISLTQSNIQNYSLIYKSEINKNIKVYSLQSSSLFTSIYKFTSFSSASATESEYNSALEKWTMEIPDPTTNGPFIDDFLNGASHKAVLKLTYLNSASPQYFKIVIGGGTLPTPTKVGDVENTYKLSLSFDGIQSQEPFINNGVDRVFLFFGGSATIVDSRVTLGNDIIKTLIIPFKHNGNYTLPSVVFGMPNYQVEPIEIPASLSVSDDTYQTYANGYRTIDRNMAVGNKISYSFVYDNTNNLYNGLYEYARYGTNASTYANVEFTLKEFRYAFGKMTVNIFYAKLGDVATSNTNGDVMNITATFKVGAY